VDAISMISWSYDDFDFEIALREVDHPVVP